MARLSQSAPFETYHRNDQPARLRDTYDEPPVVEAETDDGFVVLLRPDDLAACHGSVERLVLAVERERTKSNLYWPA